MSGERLRANPFFVLGLRPDCGRAEVEREGQKLLAMLELDLAAARTYASPLGVHPRSAELVREAMAELRDPERRLIHELWATLPAGSSPETQTPETESHATEAHATEAHATEPSDRPAPRADGFALLGFTRGSR